MVLEGFFFLGFEGLDLVLKGGGPVEQGLVVEAQVLGI